MVEQRGPQYQLPQRKPVPPPSSHAKLKPLTQINPEGQDSNAPPINASHSRTRTSSSSVFPHMSPTPTFSPVQQPASPGTYQSTMNQYTLNNARRTLSNATTSSTATGAGGGLIPARTASSTSTRRSTSIRSSTLASGYVALMRKQKATVWCDRSQHEDPRIAAQQKAARTRAAKEVGGLGGRSGTGSMASGSVASRKIRHPAMFKPMSTGYSSGSLAGGVASVPLRLSASEVGDEDRRDTGDTHQRTSSGKSSLGSARRQTGLSSTSDNTGGKYGQGPAPAGTDDVSPDGATQFGESPNGQEARDPRRDYFEHTPTGISGESGSSGERENSFGDVGQIAPTSGVPKTGHNPDELRRRGSVDDRTTTMTGVRLFVANPDLSD
ncbi:MAG: hypothetical protein M1833_001826 [Piccolia ochrophora]|nr:MAG: hypothetical protein M1833_001826 [Piccolia ochrophora]